MVQLAFVYYSSEQYAAARKTIADAADLIAHAPTAYSNIVRPPSCVDLMDLLLIDTYISLVGLLVARPHRRAAWQEELCARRTRRGRGGQRSVSSSGG